VLFCLRSEVNFAALWVVTSKITAAARTAPRTMYCTLEPTPIRFMPQISEIITSAPITLPTPSAAD
jgi:hypothetical protein